MRFFRSHKKQLHAQKTRIIQQYNDAIEKLIEDLPCNSTITHLDLDIGVVQEQTAIRLCSLLERSTGVRSLAIKMYQADKAEIS